MSGGSKLSRRRKPYRHINKIGFKPRQITMSFFVVAVLLVLILIIDPGTLRAATQGANSPVTAVNDTGTGTIAWSNPGNVVSSNDVRATTANMTNGQVSNYIKATNFGFSIPSGSTINGIVAEIERSEGGASSGVVINDSSVKIVKNGTISSTNLAATSTDWPSTDAYASYGSSSNLWGESWGTSDINASTFGVAVSATSIRNSGNPNSPETARVDHIRITVHYTLPPTTYDQSSYRWFANSNGTNVGSALANKDTVASAPVKNTAFRLRTTLHVGATNLAQNGETFKLQFAKKGGGSCASPGDAYADVTTSSAIQYYDNASASDGAALTTNANDPQHSTHTTRAQTYEEVNTFTNSQAAISVGEDGLWDFALVDNTADYNSAYCFRTVKNTGSTPLDTYSVYPEITTAAAPTIDQSAYRLFEHQDAIQEFGTSGVVTGASASFFGRAIATDGSYMYVAGDDDAQDWRIEKRSLSNGAVDNGFGTSGVVTGASPSLVARGIAIDSTYMYVVGTDVNGDWRIEKRSLSNGAVDNGFGTSGVVTGATAGNTAFSIAIDGSYMYIAGYTDSQDWRIEKRSLSNGAVDNGFGTSGVVTVTAGFIAYGISIDSTYMYVAGYDDSSDWRIEKRALSNGAVDNGFGTSGVVTGAAASNISRSIAIDGSYMYVVGDDATGDWRIEKRSLSNGAVDNGFGTSGVVTGASAGVLAYFIAIDGSNMYVAGNDATGDWRIEKRSLSNGAVDNGFGTSGVVTGASASDTAIAASIDGGYMYVAGEDVNDDWRIEKRALSNGGLASADSADVGSALASQDTSATLTSTGQEFRLRLDLHVNTNKLKTSGQNFKLQSAKKGTGSCASPEFSYADASPSSGDIRYNGSSNDGLPLTDNANDPAHSGHTNNNQTYEEANNFTNSESVISAGEDGLWDFALIDNSAPGDTAYCFKVVDSSGTALNSYGVYPEITTFNPGGGGTTTDIVDASGDPVASPAFSLASHTLSFDCESVSGTFGSSGQRIRITNGFTAENWSLTLAATSGAAALWSGGPTDYDFNDSNGSPGGCGDGADSDSLPGQMSFDPSAGTLTPKSGCTNTGVTKGSSNSFIEGVTDDLTILSGTTASDTDCYWDLTDIDANQQIPADQPPGSYSISLTLTLTVF